MAHGSIYWSELATSDVEAAKDHYAKIAGWTFEGMDMGGGTYWVASHDGRAIAGIMDLKLIPHPVPPHWLTYVAVDDMDAAMGIVADTGGKVIREPFDVPGVGIIAIVSEPGGGGYGLIEPAPMPAS
ncbi:VOC family protein [Acuticoccus kandeliae]|uniref:VOC family protein n=1 Tax=Acuticoccus kandeliae TaxID=2073160 RepID=UPI000D3E6D75|nr:VOC family protein [Acuticoccus kandeliae]